MKGFYSRSFLLTGILFFYLTTDVFAENSCNFNVKVKQVLLNEGFHRNITYGIVFDTKKYGGNKWLYKDCIIALDQTLPAGVYVNPDEIGDLRRNVKLNVIPKNKVNVELPAEQSEPTSVYIMGNIIDNKANLWFPLHARYHQAVAGGGSARNEIGPPKLYLRCPDQRLDLCSKGVAPPVTFLCNGSSKEKCSWKEIPCTMLTDTLIWDVPVGDLEHYYAVALGTTIVIVSGSVYLLQAAHEYRVNRRRKAL